MVTLGLKNWPLSGRLYQTVGSGLTANGIRVKYYPATAFCACAANRVISPARFSCTRVSQADIILRSTTVPLT